MINLGAQHLKRPKTEQLERIVDHAPCRPSSEHKFDVETAISVCRQAQYVTPPFTLGRIKNALLEHVAEVPA
jgi:hypothetical protein